MDQITSIALLAVLAAGCRSEAYREGSASPEVDDDVFVHVPESELDGISRVRADLNEQQDRVAMAEHDVQQEKQLLEVARTELRAAEAGVHAAKKGLQVARDSDQGARETEMKLATEKLEAARARVIAAQRESAFRAARIEQLESQTRLARVRADLEQARVQLAKAQAVSKLDRPEAKEISVQEFEFAVREHEARVAMAEIDADAWDRKVKIRQEALEAREARAASSER